MSQRRTPTTLVGIADPRPVEQRVSVPIDASITTTDMALRPPSPSLSPRRARGKPMLEVEVVHSHGPSPSLETPWKVFEIWTQNHVYVLDPQMTCVEVLDRTTRRVVRRHPMLGLRLVGGQHRSGDRIEISYPFPRPGSEAVFENPRGRRGNFSQTSPVARVVLRLHVATVAPSSLVPSWEEISSAFEANGPDD
ncbi:MAG: hypothetical protein NZ898_03615 [Myxococcota bacterium]|nr:hypothetical protein [Myxococcota bacterium]MDW8361196.1 hypothetical protein [Myxococcales bacterium]